MSKIYFKSITLIIRISNFLFSFQDGSGKLDFREYVIGLSLMSMPANSDATITLAFKVNQLVFCAVFLNQLS